MSQLLLGVDGGATKTIALIADEAGTVLGAGRAGSSDIHNEASPGIAIKNVAAAVREATAAAGVEAPDLDGCVLGLCGADWPEDEILYATELRNELRLSRSPTVINDAFNSLRAGTADGIGVALVLGTGGAIAARGPDGHSWFSGERMERSGALEFGRWVYDLVLRGEYGDGPRPSFQAAATAAFGTDSVETMVNMITRSGGLGYRSVGRLASVLLEAGHGGDPDAARLLDDHARTLTGYVRRAAARVGLGPDAAVVLAGGVFKHHATELRDAIASGLPEAHVAPATLEPAFGALLMAADEIARRPDPDRLVATGPDPSFFDTGAAV